MSLSDDTSRHTRFVLSLTSQIRMAKFSIATSFSTMSSPPEIDWTSVILAGAKCSRLVLLPIHTVLKVMSSTRRTTNILVTWTENEHPSGAQVGNVPTTFNPSWRSAQNFTKEAHMFGICRKSNMFTRESRAEMLGIFNKPPSNAVVRATEMSRAEMWERMGALRTYHQVTLLNEINSAACDALWRTRQEVCSVKQRQNFKSINGKVTIICKSISKAFDATCHNFNKTFKSRDKCLSLLLKCTFYQNQYTTIRSGASESASEIQQLRCLDVDRQKVEDSAG